MHRRAIAVIVIALVAISACSDGSAATGDGTPTGAGPVTGATDPIGAVTNGSTPEGGEQGSGEGAPTTATEGGVNPTTAGSAITVPGGSNSSVSGSATTVKAPTTTLPAVSPPPPVAGCVDAAAGPAIVELSFDNDTLRYGTAVAPPCVRIHATQRLRVSNDADFSSSGSIGAQTFSLAEDGSITTAVIGTTRKVGDVFDVRVNVLSASVVVQVLP
ncbi:MAG: hypothetical protein Q7V57_15555 [Actinomycetota bacterium]|nr:hypothetical protein [Actinomycetota bacterium]